MGVHPSQCAHTECDYPTGESDALYIHTQGYTHVKGFYFHGLAMRMTHILIPTHYIYRRMSTLDRTPHLWVNNLKWIANRSRMNPTHYILEPLTGELPCEGDVPKVERIIWHVFCLARCVPIYPMRSIECSYELFILNRKLFEEILDNLNKVRSLRLAHVTYRPLPTGCTLHGKGFRTILGGCTMKATLSVDMLLSHVIQGLQPVLEPFKP